MKKIYWILPLVLIILVVVAVGYIKNQQKNIGNQNLCQQVISLNDIRNLCNNQGVQENNNESYYITPENTTVMGNSQVTYALDGAEISRCLKVINTLDYNFTSNEGSTLVLFISTLNSKESASKFFENAITFNDSNSWEKASKDALTLNENPTEFGEKANIVVYKAGDIYSPEENMTIHLSKNIGITFLKGSKVISIVSDSYNQSIPLLCELDNLKKLATFIDKKIS